MPDEKNGHLNERPPEDRPEASGSPSHSEEGRNDASRSKRVIKAILAVVVSFGALWIGLIVLLVLLLQTHPATQLASRVLIEAANPYEEAELTAERVRGTWVSSLRFYNVELYREVNDEDTLRMAQIDTLEVEYNLLGLLGGTLHLRNIYASGIDAQARQFEDGTWDLFDPFIPDPDEEPVDPLFDIRIDQADVSRLQASAEFYSPDRDSTLHLTYFDGSVRDVFVGDDEIALDLQSLQAGFIPPAEEIEREIDASLHLSERHLAVRRFNVDSPYSHLTADGLLRFPEDPDERVDDVAFVLEADPLDFRDLAGWFPNLDPRRSIQLTLAAEGSERLVDLELSALFSDGATIDADGSLSPAPDEVGARSYQLEAEVRGFDPYFFTTGVDQPRARFSADLSADLEGPELERIDGPLRIQLYDAVWDQYRIDWTTLLAEFTDGQAAIDFAGGLHGARLTADGTVRPFDEIPQYDVRSQFANVDLRRFTLEGTPTNLVGRLHVRGQGSDMATAEVDADLVLDRSSINRYQLTRADIEAALRDGTLGFDGRVRSPQGGIATRGEIADLGNVPTYRIPEGRLEGLDVAALAGDTVRSEINATFAFHGQGTDVETMVIEQARLRAVNSFYGHYPIASADLAAGLRRGQLDMRGNVDMAEAGRFTLAATARPFQPTIPWAVTHGTFEDVDIGVLTQEPEQTSDLTGTFTAQGWGTEPETMVAEGTMELAPSSFNEEQIDSALLQADLDRGDLDYALELHLPEGSTFLAGTALPFADPIVYTAEGRVEALNIGALTGQPEMQTSLFGDVRIEGRGTEAETMFLDAEVDFGESQINFQTIAGGHMEMLLAQGEGHLQAELIMEDEGRIATDAAVRLTTPELEYEADVALSQIRLGPLLGTDTLNTRITADAHLIGRGTDPETMYLSGVVRGEDVRYDGLVSDRLDADFTLNDGLLLVDTFVLESNLATAEASGRIALFETAEGLRSDFRLVAEVQSLDPVRPFIDAERFALRDGRIDARIAGPYDALRFDVRAEGGGLVYNEIRLAGFDASAVGELDADYEIELAELDLDARYFSTPQFTTERISVQADLLEAEIHFATDVLVDAQREAHLAGVFELHPDMQRLVLADMDMRMNGDEWELLQPTSLTFNDEYRIRNFLLFSEDQQIAIDGVIDFDGEQNLVLTVEDFRIGAVADLLGYEGLDGRLNGFVDLTGPAVEPELSGLLDLELISDGRRVGDLVAALDYSELELNIDAAIEHEDGSIMTAEGFLPMDLRLVANDDTVTVAPELLGAREMSLTIDAEDFAIDWVRPFLDPETVARIDGRLTALVMVNGEPDAPELSGDAILTQGLVMLPDLGTTYRDIQAVMEFTGDQMIVQRSRMRSGDGELNATGTINMTALTLGEYDLDVTARNFLAINTRLYRAVTDADLQVQGTLAEPYVEGGIRILSGDVRLGDEMTSPDVEEVDLTEEDLQILQQRFGILIAEEEIEGPDYYEATAMNIDVRLERDTWLRSRANPDMDVQFTGNLDLRKEHHEELLLFGSIEVVPARSRVVQFGRRFNITEGTVTFNGPVDDPLFEVGAEYVVPSRRHRDQEVLITLSLSGRPDDLDLELGSQPAGMDGTDIASYLIMGRPAGAGMVQGTHGTVGMAGDVAFGQLTTLLENVAGAELGLDVMDIEQDPYRGVTVITAGSYLTPRLFVGISQPIELGSPLRQQRIVGDVDYTEVTIEYELQRWLLVRLLRRNYIQMNLLWDYSY